jgi:hypothetical protein
MGPVTSQRRQAMIFRFWRRGASAALPARIEGGAAAPPSVAGGIKSSAAIYLNGSRDRIAASQNCM